MAREGTSKGAMGVGGIFPFLHSCIGTKNELEKNTEKSDKQNIFDSHKQTDHTGRGRKEHMHQRIRYLGE